MSDTVEFGLQIDDSQVRRLFERAPGAVKARARRVVEAGAIDTQREMITQMPVGVTGYARRSVTYQLDLAGMRARVFPMAEYAEAIQEGTEPHHVSIAEGTPLRQWAEFRDLDPYAVQTAIELRGTKANPFATRTFYRVKDPVQRLMVQGMTDLISEFSRGDV